jgi:DNA-binding protein HU-beta
MFVETGSPPGLRKRKPATKPRQGTNPCTGEAMTFEAKPARKIVRAGSVTGCQ